MQRGGIDLPVVAGRAGLDRDRPRAVAAVEPTDPPSVEPATDPAVVDGELRDPEPLGRGVAVADRLAVAHAVAVAERAAVAIAAPDDRPGRDADARADARADAQADEEADRATATSSSTPCPDQPNCWIYTVRSGDNLFSIAHYFGHPAEHDLRLEPAVRQRRPPRASATRSGCHRPRADRPRERVGALGAGRRQRPSPGPAGGRRPRTAGRGAHTRCAFIVART